MLLLLWLFISRQKFKELHLQNVVLKLQAQMGWVSRKKKGLYFVYFKHYRHPKGEKVQRGKVWFHLVCAYTIFVFQTLCSTPETIHVLKSDNKKKKSERSD